MDSVKNWGRFRRDSFEKKNSFYVIWGGGCSESVSSEHEFDILGTKHLNIFL